MKQQEKIDEAVNQTLKDIIDEMTRHLYDASRWGANRKYFEAFNECKAMIERRMRSGIDAGTITPEVDQSMKTTTTNSGNIKK